MVPSYNQVPPFDRGTIFQYGLVIKYDENINILIYTKIAT
jgi:hypothetical protein